MNELATALSMKRNGDQTLDAKEKASKVAEMQDLWEEYVSAAAKLDYVDDVWWDENKIEESFGSSKFHNAHRKRKKLENTVKRLHKEMFLLLTKTDGFTIPFESGFSTEAKECYLEFMSKYN